MTAQLLIEETLHPCDAFAISALLKLRPKLADAGLRVPLFRKLLASSEHPDRLGSLRYLIHGNPDLSTEVPLLIESAGDDVWARITRKAVASDPTSGHMVSLLPVVAELNSSQRARLNLHGIDPDGTAKVLVNVEVNVFEWEFTDAERASILRAWENRGELLRSLPLHRGTDGHCYSIKPLHFWRGDFDPPAEVRDLCTILIREADPRLAAIQQQLAPVFDETKMLEVALDNAAHDYWKSIAAALSRIGSPRSDLRERLITAPWLPSISGEFVAPKRVLAHTAYGRTVEFLLAGQTPVAGDPVLESRLSEELRVHDGYSAIGRLFPNAGGFFDLLAPLLVREPRFQIGKIDLRTPDRTTDWLRSFDDAPADIMPVVELVRVVSAGADGLLAQRLVPNLDRAVPIDRLQKILAYLERRHGEADGQAKQKIERVFGAYLGLLAAESECVERLDGLRLLNQEGQWKNPAMLCIASGVARSYQLDPRQAEMLRPVVHTQMPKPLKVGAVPAAPSSVVSLEPAFHRSVDALRQYFDGWLVDEPFCAGAFLALLGDYPPLRKVADEWLDGHRSAEVVRAESALPESMDDRKQHGLHNPIPRHLRMQKQRFLVEVAPPKKDFAVVNLFGTDKMWPGETAFEHLLIGYEISALNVLLEGGLQVHHIHLRPLLATQPADRRRKLLAHTATIIAERVYGVKGLDLGRVLEDMAKGELPDVRNAQTEMLLAAGHYLHQFGVTSPTLKGVLKQYAEAAARKAEGINAGAAKLDGTCSDELLAVASQVLRGLIEKDEAVRRVILDGVTRKLRDSRYRFDADTPRSAVSDYLKQVDQFGDSILWTVVLSTRGAKTKIAVGLKALTIPSRLFAIKGVE